MNEWLKKVLEQIKSVWAKWTTVQKVILFSIIGAVLLALVLLVSFSSRPGMVPLITTPITDASLRDQISVKLDELGVKHTVTPDGRILVQNEQTARRMIGILARDDLIPQGTSPWAIFKMNSWTVTDFERQVNLRQAIEKNLEEFIESLDDVDSAKVTLVIPQQSVFTEDQNPVTASVIITPRPGSDIETNRQKLEGIQRLVKLAVGGLKDENIVITDEHGIVLNDFSNLANVDNLELAKRQMQQKAILEEQNSQLILTALQSIFGKDRVRVLNVNVDVTFDKKTVNTKEYFPITMVKDNPNTPYDETQTVPNVLRSETSDNESFKGTGFNPQGPPGQEGQTAPAYKDLSNLVGNYSKDSSTKNYEVNQRDIQQVDSPWQIVRKTAAVAIDGQWKTDYDAKGHVIVNPDGSIKRTYIPVSATDLQTAQKLVEDAIGYNKARGDSVTVEQLQFDRSAQFKAEDQQYRNQARLRQTILFSLLGLAAVVIIFILFRIISRELERRRRLREEELSRQHQAMREAALRSAEEEGIDVEMSVEERARLEMQENAVNMAREHPEDVAQLIRTWLVEE